MAGYPTHLPCTPGRSALSFLRPTLISAWQGGELGGGIGSVPWGQEAPISHHERGQAVLSGGRDLLPLNACQECPGLLLLLPFPFLTCSLPPSFPQPAQLQKPLSWRGETASLPVPGQEGRGDGRLFLFKPSLLPSIPIYPALSFALALPSCVQWGRGRDIPRRPQGGKRESALS